MNAPQSVAGSNGALNISLPTSGLFSFRTAPGQPYLIATDPRLTSYTKFISSDYMLSALNLNPQQVQKRLGDGFYEESWCATRSRSSPGASICRATAITKTSTAR